MMAVMVIFLLCGKANSHLIDSSACRANHDWKHSDRACVCARDAFTRRHLDTSNVLFIPNYYT